MGRVVTWLLLVTGCYAPHASENVPCGEAPDRACPAGQTCGPDDHCHGLADAANQQDARIDGNAAFDTDGDGIDDSIDNCIAMPNADQRDHDGDNVGDVCDNCPHIANQSQAAADDGVGDACDPAPGRDDMLLYFEGFYETPASWVLPTGWSVGNGALVGTIASGSSVAFLDLPLQSHITVVTGVTLMPSATGGMASNAGVLAHLDGNSVGDFYRCSQVTSRIELAKHQGGAFMNLSQMDENNPTLTDVNLSVDVDDGAAAGTVSLSCVVTSTMSKSLSGSDATPLAGDRVGLRVRDGTATFDYVVIFGH